MQKKLVEGRKMLAEQFGFSVQGEDFVKQMGCVELRLHRAAIANPEDGILMKMSSPHFAPMAKLFEVAFPDLNQGISGMSNDNLCMLVCYSARHCVRNEDQEKYAESFRDLGPLLTHKKDFLDVDMDRMCNIALGVYEAELI